jgi:chromosome partitioning protein
MSRKTLYHAIVMKESLKNIILTTELPLLFVLPSDKNLVGAEIELVENTNREYELKRILNKVRNEYDYIIIDCPPSLGLLTINALTAADSLLVPIQCEYFALEGVTELFDTLARLRRGLNPQLTIEGLLLTMYDERTNLSAAVAQDLRDFYGKQVLKTVIPRNVRLAEAPSYGKPIILYDIRSKGAESYIQLAKEILSHE